MRYIVAVGAIAFAIIISVPATPRAQAVGPRAITNAIEQASTECRTYGGTFMAGEGFDTRLSLNEDEAPDHILNFGAAECRDARDDYAGAARGGERDNGCGRDGCRVQVFVSGPRGHQQVFNEPVWNFSTVKNTAPARVSFSASSMPGCEASYAEGCHAEWGWANGQFVHLRWLTQDAVGNTSRDGAVSSSQPPEPFQDDEQQIRQFMAAVYEPYKRDDFSRSEPEMFTPSLERMMTEASDPDAGFGCDVIVGGQDYDRVDYRIDRVQIEGDRAHVSVRYTTFGSPWRVKVYMLEKRSGGWLIDDMIWPNGERFRQTLSC